MCEEQLWGCVRVCVCTHIPGPGVCVHACAHVSLALVCVSVRSSSGCVSGCVCVHTYPWPWCVCVQVQGRQGVPATPEAERKASNRFSLQARTGSTVLPTPGFWTSGLQNCEKPVPGFFQLHYNCFTVLCYFLLYNNVNQSYVYIYPLPPGPSSYPPL